MASHPRTDWNESAGLAGSIEHVSETTVLAGSVLAAGRARSFVEEMLCPVHARSALSAVTLAASEMATQAVLGGRGPMTLTLSCQVTSVTLAVTYTTDTATYDVRLRLADEVAAKIIEGISRASGNDVVDGRQRMWCTIPTGFVPMPAHSGPR